MSFENAKRIFIQEKARFNKGYGEVSWVKGLYETFVLVFIASSISGFTIPSYLYLVLPLFCIVCLWVIGYLWDRTHLFNVEAEFGNKRNFFVKELRKHIKKRKL